MNGKSTGFSRTSEVKVTQRSAEQHNNDLKLGNRETEQLRGTDVDEHKKLHKNDCQDGSLWLKIEPILAPILFTLAAMYVRMHRIGANNHVVWDEAHFGKFGSYYLRHEFYHDVHPPLGKMLVGLSGYLAGYNGSWDFPSGNEYPEYINFVRMRIFNAMFSALCAPVAYFTAKTIGFSLPAVWLFATMVTFENSYATLGRMILLDSMLLFFTVLSVLCLVKFHAVRSEPFTPRWWRWLALTGVSIGCTISVKMVGLFVITLVGIYTALELWNMLSDSKLNWRVYARHWCARIICLIVIPTCVFMLCFKIHFSLLYKSGTGDGNMPSLFQARLVNSSIGEGPRDIAIGTSIITLKNQALGGALLHSHVQTFPEGSKQQQVTAYGHTDNNNEWYIQKTRKQEPIRWEDENAPIEFVQANEEYRLIHMHTGKNLHSHEIAAPMSKTGFEVSGYGHVDQGDDKDNWVIEVVEQVGKEDTKKIHPLTTSIRLKHSVLGCYLAQTGTQLPAWGFRQFEIACLKNPFKSDKRTWWNVESHVNSKLPAKPENFTYPSIGFIKEFMFLNLAMMRTNNALKPDQDKNDALASSAWQWPTLYLGLRLNGWDDDNVKYFLLGTPLTTWASTLAVAGLMLYIVWLIFRWRRQFKVLSDPKKADLFLMGAFYPLLGWGLHYLPFCIMGRVTYVHHYLPALYFALIVLTYACDATMTAIKETYKGGRTVRAIFFIVFNLAVVACFAYFAPISFGMDKPKTEYEYLNLLPTWKISRDE